ncbi:MULTISPECIES: hypothetical protein [unclassified Butyrivibrio]|uniref:hypothetical protein n=1 Tax=unclassified Butyrivibrio TaxID=2639466 RepID=UPI0003B3ECC9|nr:MULTISPECIES: hypothetical protein [unclassified Butyrivibrio]SDB13959.1 hypothetical protein SAMN02910263_00647 [Butyrivibrio sp. INlla16]
MKIKFDKYHCRLGKAEHTILVPRDIDVLQWNTIGLDWGNELIGDRRALYALMYTCAILTFDEMKIVYFPIKKNEKLYEKFWDYRHDVVFTCNKSGLHTADWKKYRQMISKMPPESYEFYYDRDRIDLFAQEYKDNYYKVMDKREKTCVGYEKDQFDTWIVAMDKFAFLSGYENLRKLADRNLELEFIKCGEYPPYDIFLTYELSTRLFHSYKAAYCYGFMFYDPSLHRQKELYEAARKPEAPKVFPKKKKLELNEHDTTKTRGQIKKINESIAKKKRKKKNDTTDKLRNGTR